MLNSHIPMTRWTYGIRIFGNRQIFGWQTYDFRFKGKATAVQSWFIDFCGKRILSA